MDGSLFTGIESEPDSSGFEPFLLMRFRSMRISLSLCWISNFNLGKEVYGKRESNNFRISSLEEVSLLFSLLFSKELFRILALVDRAEEPPESALFNKSL